MSESITLYKTEDNRTPRLHYLAGAGLIGASVLLRAINPIFFKLGAGQIQSFTPLEVLTNIFYIIGFATIFFRTALWQITLRYFPLSFAYSFFSLTFVVILVASHILFDEPITLWNILGTMIIMAGIVILTSEQNSKSL